MIDVIVIGGGTAGLTAALYLARAGKSVSVFESGAFGGQIVTSPKVENYPGIKEISGIDFAMGLLDQVSDLAVNFETDRIVSVQKNADGTFALTGDEGTYACRAVIVATGARCRALGLADESRFIGEGVSYCALCDGAFFKGKTVAVVGGGNSALEEVEYLAGICKKVYLVHRRTAFRAESAVVDKLNALANVELCLSRTVSALIGDTSLQSIVLSSTVGEPDVKVDVDGLFVSIGRVPDTDCVKNLLTLDAGGYIVAGEDCSTEIAGIYPAGDCRTKAVRQLTTAVADGAISAVKAMEYLDR